MTYQSLVIRAGGGDLGLCFVLTVFCYVDLVLVLLHRSNSSISHAKIGFGMIVIRGIYELEGKPKASGTRVGWGGGRLGTRSVGISKPEWCAK